MPDKDTAPGHKAPEAEENTRAGLASAGQAGEEAASLAPLAEEEAFSGEELLAQSRAAARRRRGRQRAKRLLFTAVLLVLVGALAFNVLAGLLKGPDPTYVELATAARGDIHQSLSTTGTLITGEKVTVFCPVTAPLAQVLAEIGRPVEKGRLLFAFETKDLERSLRQAEANRGIASIQREDALALSEQSIQQAEDYRVAADQTKDQLAMAAERLAEVSASALAAEAENSALTLELVDKQVALLAIPDKGSPEAQKLQGEIDALNTRVNELTLRMASLATAQELAGQDVAYQQNLIAQLEALAQTADRAVLEDSDKSVLSLQGVSGQVAYEVALENYDRAAAGVSAPISGIITSLSAEEGARAAQYGALCVVESVDKVDVVVSLSRFDLERVAEGQEATVTTLGKTYTARVSKINAMATQSGSSSYVAARVSLDKPDGDIKLGLEAEVEIATGFAGDVLVIPAGAVNTDVGGTYCYIMEEGAARRRNIELGLSSDTGVEILSGLAEGDQVVLASHNISEGDALTTDPAYYVPEAGGFLSMLG